MELARCETYTDHYTFTRTTGNMEIKFLTNKINEREKQENNGSEPRSSIIEKES